MTRVIIAGSRQFNDYKLMLNTLDEFGVHLINTIDPVEIISGHAPGWGEICHNLWIPFKNFPS